MFLKDRLILSRILFGLLQSKFGPKLALLMLFVYKEHLIFIIAIDIDNLLVKTKIKYCVFDNHQVKLAKNGKISIRIKVEVGLAPFEAYRDSVIVLQACSSGRFNQSG